MTVGEKTERKIGQEGLLVPKIIGSWFEFCYTAAMKDSVVLQILVFQSFSLELQLFWKHNNCSQSSFLSFFFI